ncbi:MAG: DEAD/DEAH box helicase [Gammaproteobacteria bacterium]|nr:DEAD/DEAH box helicase [Gammaproteobacteria bacterium]
MTSPTENTPQFTDLGLSKDVLEALKVIGYETPSPIQAAIIPHVLNSRDVIGQAQTGTGKTAAFALPLLSQIDVRRNETQVLVLTPTRELAIQVAEAFQKYASHIKGFHVAPIYGGQDYGVQIRALKRGVHIVVGTPGRVTDHMRRGTLKLGGLKALVLDEADEMLRMGFVEEVEWVLEQTPDTRQICLFSATMPKVIRQIAQKYLNNPEEITIKVKTTTAENIRQRYWLVSGLHKLDALTRILEAETFDGVIIFVRTKTATVELADKLRARGYAAAELNGDIIQKQRERTVNQLKKGDLDIVIATDVAARGLDVQRVSHVINYDIPYDAEAYVHRIGRTGRAGRSGDAIMFVAPRERRMLNTIERATNQKMDIMELPSTEVINDKRIATFKQRITDTLASNDELNLYQQVLEQYQHEHNIPVIEIAAALAKIAQGDSSLLLKKETARPSRQRDEHKPRERNSGERSNRGNEHGHGRDRGRDRDRNSDSERKPKRSHHETDEDMESFRIEVGHEHDVKPSNVIGAIANEAGIDSKYIGRLQIFDDHSVIDLPSDMPKEIFMDLKKAWVCGQQLKIKRLNEKSGSDSSSKQHKPKRSAPPKAQRKPKKLKEKKAS